LEGNGGARERAHGFRGFQLNWKIRQDRKGGGNMKRAMLLRGTTLLTAGRPLQGHNGVKRDRKRLFKKKKEGPIPQQSHDVGTKQSPTE